MELYAVFLLCCHDNIGQKPVHMMPERDVL